MNDPLNEISLPMHRALRCNTVTRSGTPCRAPAVRGRDRCRAHDGAEFGVGAGHAPVPVAAQVDPEVSRLYRAMWLEIVDEIERWADEGMVDADGLAALIDVARRLNRGDGSPDEFLAFYDCVVGGLGAQHLMEHVAALIA